MEPEEDCPSTISAKIPDSGVAVPLLNVEQQALEITPGTSQPEDSRASCDDPTEPEDGPPIISAVMLNSGVAVALLDVAPRQSLQIIPGPSQPTYESSGSEEEETDEVEQTNISEGGSNYVDALRAQVEEEEDEEDEEETDEVEQTNISGGGSSYVDALRAQVADASSSASIPNPNAEPTPVPSHGNDTLSYFDSGRFLGMPERQRRLSLRARRASASTVGTFEEGRATTMGGEPNFEPPLLSKKSKSQGSDDLFGSFELGRFPGMPERQRRLSLRARRASASTAGSFEEGRATTMGGEPNFEPPLLSQKSKSQGNDDLFGSFDSGRFPGMPERQRRLSLRARRASASTVGSFEEGRATTMGGSDSIRRAASMRRGMRMSGRQMSGNQGVLDFSALASALATDSTLFASAKYPSQDFSPKKGPSLEPQSAGSFTAIVTRLMVIHGLGGGSSSVEVVLAKDSTTGNVYAMKVTDKANLEEKRNQRRLRNELRALIDIPHCRFLERCHLVFESPRRVFACVDFNAGGSLFSLLLKQVQSNGTGFGEDACRVLLAETTLALEHLHSFGFVHRGLTMECLHLDGDGHVRLTDLRLCSELTVMGGLKHRHADQQDGQGLVDCTRFHQELMNPAGSLLYMAPELLTEGKGGRQTDWWALGIIAHELFTGLAPFSSLTDKVMIEHEIKTIRVGPPVGCSPQVAQLACGLLDPDPKARLGSTSPLRAAPFFRDLDWQAARERTLPPALTFEGCGAPGAGGGSPQGADLEACMALADTEACAASLRRYEDGCLSEAEGHGSGGSNGGFEIDLTNYTASSHALMLGLPQVPRSPQTAKASPMAL